MKMPQNISALCFTDIIIYIEPVGQSEMKLCSQAVPLTALGLFSGLKPGIIVLSMYLQMYIVI